MAVHSHSKTMLGHPIPADDPVVDARQEPPHYEEPPHYGPGISLPTAGHEQGPTIPSRVASLSSPNPNTRDLVPIRSFAFVKNT